MINKLIYKIYSLTNEKITIIEESLETYLGFQFSRLRIRITQITVKLVRLFAYFIPNNMCLV